MVSNPLGPLRSCHSLATPAANPIPAAARASRVASTRIAVATNEALACSSRSGRNRPTCQRRTSGEGNGASAATEVVVLSGSAHATDGASTSASKRTVST